MEHNLRHTRQKIIKLVIQAAKLAKTIGIPNLLQPGLVKEMIIADILGHEVISKKREPDARDPDDHTILYEYLSCKEGGRGQFDRMYKTSPEKRRNSLRRILRNSKIYLAIFYKNDQTKVKIIYELEPKLVAKEARRKLKKSKNEISHIGFSERWARENGKIVYSHE